MVNTSKRDLETCQWGLAVHSRADLKRAPFARNAKAPPKSQGLHACHNSAAFVVKMP
jgi:hypothetical protein